MTGCLELTFIPGRRIRGGNASAEVPTSWATLDLAIPGMLQTPLSLWHESTDKEFNNSWQRSKGGA